MPTAKVQVLVLMYVYKSRHDVQRILPEIHNRKIDIIFVQIRIRVLSIKIGPITIVRLIYSEIDCPLM